MGEGSWLLHVPQEAYRADRPNRRGAPVSGGVSVVAWKRLSFQKSESRCRRLFRCKAPHVLNVSVPMMRLVKYGTGRPGEWGSSAGSFLSACPLPGTESLRMHLASLKYPVASVSACVRVGVPLPWPPGEAMGCATSPGFRTTVMASALQFFRVAVLPQ